MIIHTKIITLDPRSDVFVFLMIRRPPRSTQSRSSAASDVYKRQGNPRALNALDQYLHGTVRQFQKLQHSTDCTDRVDIIRRRIVVGSILLRYQKDLLVILHDIFESAH
eukprot:TRINITY_DN23627_c0_g1_i1.p1 TRINITY_DN23627_c0_g1~~TRINITY_DN23627_c0_g1_i1.p1  ORF type:complete len:109 (-),score=39.63 TRINITY_DN23627_c0_g1_i1:271-597(-)